MPTRDEKYYRLPADTVKQLKKLKGPIVIFGAGGFIGINLLKSLLLYRKDVFGISQDHTNNWRFAAAKVPPANIVSCDINDFTQLLEQIDHLKPQTIFNLAAYGAYSKQKEYKKIYYTNFNSSVDIIEILKQRGFSAYLQAGSSSEYGLNSAGPSEKEELIPNSHYAVSKAAVWHAIKYYRQVEKLPVAHLRIYSAYGPWEEPDRLVPVLISHARRKLFPPLVQPEVSRDFIYITDITSAFISAASMLSENNFPDKPLNIGTGKKTSIRELALLVKKIAGISAKPKFGSMKNRNWDVQDWYANIRNTEEVLNWSPVMDLNSGLSKVIAWQNEMDFDNAPWNWARK